ncbi:MAG: Nudix family hydrolase [Gammaproteobacteria bacterium]|nr:Nudix family hydrolase [Gammaproteobacteria bacterium]
MSVKVVQVVLAAIFDAKGRLLITRRAKQAHQGGFWELPGGKQETGETLFVALQRELQEEVGIRITASTPLINITHVYPDVTVCLNVWRVTAFEGEATAREGQPLRWIELSELPKYSFPKANRAILQALLLPETYLITPEPTDRAVFLSTLEQSLSTGIKLVQLRAKNLSVLEYENLAQEVVSLCHRWGAKVLLNSPPDLLQRVAADGLHLSQRLAASFSQRPVADDCLLALSCHDETSLRQGSLIGADFAVLSPVQPTMSHPEAQPLGWPAFQALVKQAALPVYALGGLSKTDGVAAQQRGGQGVAAIRSLWGEKR